MKAFKINGTDGVLRYHDLPGEGTPLLFIHGIGCSGSYDYPAVAAESCLTARRRLLIDLPGHGYSDAPVKFSYTIVAQAEVAAALVASLGTRFVDIFGHSMGGSIAIVAAKILGDRVAHLVVGEPNLDPGGGIFSRRIASYSEEDYVRTGHRAMIAEEQARGNCNWAACLAVASPVAVHRSAGSLVKGMAPNFRETLRSLPCPRTILIAERSLPNPDTDALPKGGVAVRIVHNASHSMAYDNPTGLAEAIAAAIGQRE